MVWAQKGKASPLMATAPTPLTIYCFNGFENSVCCHSYCTIYLLTGFVKYWLTAITFFFRNFVKLMLVSLINISNPLARDVTYRKLFDNFVIYISICYFYALLTFYRNRCIAAVSSVVILDAYVVFATIIGGYVLEEETGDTVSWSDARPLVVLQLTTLEKVNWRFNKGGQQWIL